MAEQLLLQSITIRFAQRLGFSVDGFFQNLLILILVQSLQSLFDILLCQSLHPQSLPDLDASPVVVAHLVVGVGAAISSLIDVFLLLQVCDDALTLLFIHAPCRQFLSYLAGAFLSSAT